VFKIVLVYPHCLYQHFLNSEQTLGQEDIHWSWL